MTAPTDVPTGGRRTVLVSGWMSPAPMTLPGVFRAAAGLIESRGLYQGDHVPDAMDREMCVPHWMRPMSVVAALKCATTGDPHLTSLLADQAIARLALRLEVDGEGPDFTGIFDLEEHVDRWTDAPGRSVEDAVAVLLAAAEAVAS
ncbi:hypothetical protein ACIQXD_04875 [Streptomyces uncialis]|uniref:DUF6197 family protein n=1 Tax=Streptomyces uncialis TaxID=1048205 RepID=UPI003812BD90